MALAGRESKSLSLFRDWTVSIFRLVPPWAAVPTGLVWLALALIAPDGLPLHILSAIFGCFLAIPICLTLLLRKAQRRQQSRSASAARLPTVIIVEDCAPTSVEEWEQWRVTSTAKHQRHHTSRCVLYPKCSHHQPKTNSRFPGRLRSRMELE